MVEFDKLVLSNGRDHITCLDYRKARIRDRIETDLKRGHWAQRIQNQAPWATRPVDECGALNPQVRREHSVGISDDRIDVTDVLHVGARIFWNIELFDNALTELDHGCASIFIGKIGELSFRDHPFAGKIGQEQRRCLRVEFGTLDAEKDRRDLPRRLVVDPDPG